MFFFRWCDSINMLQPVSHGFFTISSLRENIFYISLMSDDLILGNTTENRLYSLASCSSAQDLFYIDIDNIGRAIMTYHSKIVHF